MNTYEKDNRQVWYDPALRLWTLRTVDADGNQVGEADYSPSRHTAMR